MEKNSVGVGERWDIVADKLFSSFSEYYKQKLQAFDFFINGWSVGFMAKKRGQFLAICHEYFETC